MPIHARTKAPKSLRAEDCYPLQTFIAHSGISYSRISEAKKLGLEPRWLRIGKRLFITGEDAIAYIKQLAELYQSQKQVAE